MVENTAVANGSVDTANALPDQAPHAASRIFPAEVRVAFQPVTSAETGAIELHQALPRSHHGKSAAQLLRQLTPENRADYDRVLHEAAFRATRGDAEEHSIMLAINPGAMEEPAREIDGLLLRADALGIAPSRIVLSIDETTSEVGNPHLKQICRTCRRNQVHTVLTGFGSGSNGLGRLMAIRPSYLQLEPSFSRGIANDLRRRVIIASIVGLALDLGADVIASGVESEEEAAAFADCGVAFLQGSLIGEPVLERFTTQADLALPRPA